METQSIVSCDVPVVGINPLTTIDYPDRTAAVIFTAGCPWNCRYCHNPSCRDAAGANILTWEHIESFLVRRAGFLDGVVVSGGEPTIHVNLPALIEKIREFGYSIALHTNGCNPEMLLLLTRRGLVDYIAMDVKAPPYLYEHVARVSNTGVRVARSMSVILESGVNYEFRTTYHPRILTGYDLMATVRAVYNAGGRRYFIQRFRSQGVSDEELVRHGDIFDIPGDVIEEAQRLFDVFGIR